MTVQELYQPWKASSSEELDFLFEIPRLYEQNIVSGLFKPLHSIDICAKMIYDEHLYKILLDFSLSFSEKSMEETLSKYKFVYTGWQFVSLEDRIKYHKDGIDYMPFMNASEQKLPFHKIYISFERLEGEYVAAARTRHPFDVSEDIAERFMKVDWNSSDDIIIYINPDFLRSEKDIILDDTNRNYIIAAIAHELQHIVDMYVFRNFDAMLKQKGNSLYYAVRENIFGINKNTYVWDYITTISYVLTIMETRARYTQLRSFLNALANRCPVSTKQQLITSYLNFKKQLYNGDIESDSKSKTAALCSNKQIDSITQLFKLQKIFLYSTNNITSFEFSIIFSVVGYHACKLGFLTDKSLSKYLSFERVADIIRGEETADANQLRKVLNYFNEAFNKHRTNVFNVCADYSDKIFAQFSQDISVAENLNVFDRSSVLNEAVWNACYVFGC